MSYDDFGEDIPVPTDEETRMWAMALHLSQFSAYVAPVLGAVVPIVIWQIKKDKMPAIDVHGRIVVNWLLSLLIYTAISIPLIFLLVGVPLLILLSLLAVIYPIIGGIKASQGEVWKYPGTIQFF